MLATTAGVAAHAGCLWAAHLSAASTSGATEAAQATSTVAPSRNGWHDAGRQSVKTTEWGGPHGKDAHKKVNGRKRHLVVDTLGMVVAAVVHSAGIQDRDGAKPGLMHHNSESGLYGKFLVPSKPRLLPYSLATFRWYCDQYSALTFT